MKKIKIIRKQKYLVLVNGENELTTSNKKDILNLIEKELKNDDIHIVIKDLIKEE